MEKEALIITVIQSDLHWENHEKNIVDFTHKINAIREETDLIILPEMFTTGFTMRSAEHAETMDGFTVQWMLDLAAKKKCAIAGSIIINEKDKYFNRFLFVQQNGEIAAYDKRHLFRMGNEEKYFEKGKERIIIHYKGWKICPMICYDLRFPVWSRNKDNYDLLIYVANWPESRKDVWITLLKARAIENQVYVVGVNRVGNDGMKLSYSGDSVVLSSRGIAISNITSKTIMSETVTIYKNELADFRKKFPVGLDADSFEII